MIWMACKGNWMSTGNRDLLRVPEQTNATRLRKSPVLKIPAGRLLGGSIVYAGPVHACPKHLLMPSARGMVLGSSRSGAPSVGSGDTGFGSSACDICPLVPPKTGLARPLQQPLHNLCTEDTPCPPPFLLLGGGLGAGPGSGAARCLPAARGGLVGERRCGAAGPCWGQCVLVGSKAAAGTGTACDHFQVRSGGFCRVECASVRPSIFLLVPAKGSLSSWCLFTYELLSSAQPELLVWGESAY